MLKSPRTRTLLGLLTTLALLGPLVYLWQASLLPDGYSVSDMGYPDGGGGPAHSGHATGRSVASLTEDGNDPADVEVTLVARKGQFQLADGRAIDGYTLNGTSPGPVIRAIQGQVVQVRLVNESAPEGVTLHWHGVDVPNAQDGVAGVTQDAVAAGAEHVYRFRVVQAGTFWYHSHQMSHVQVQRGLLGALVITPPGDDAPDALALAHVYGGQRTINGRSGDIPVDAAPDRRCGSG